MKILHLALSNFYVENFNYQENELARQNKKDGHDVVIIASTEVPTKDDRYIYVEPSISKNEDDILVIRLPYKHIVNFFISKKIRSYVGLKEWLYELEPDIIFYHSVSSFDIMTVANYKKTHPNVKLIVDSHDDVHNSATNFLSKYILHRCIYRFFYQRTKNQIDKCFYITCEVRDFISRNYGVKDSKMSYLPLGGVPVVIDVRNRIRNKIRNKLGIKDSDIVLFHSGKMNKLKKTYELFKAFSNVKSDRLKLIVAGIFTDDVKPDVADFLERDKRIIYLGWRSPKDISDFLCATDIYMQPGSQSVTMQNALCHGCAVALFPYISHKFLLGDAFFSVSTVEDIEKLLLSILSDSNILEEMLKITKTTVTKKLDYKVLASEMYI